MGDLISRQAVLDMANTWTYNFCDPEDEWQAMKEIRDLPSTQPEIIRKPVPDVISRKEAIDAVMDLPNCPNGYSDTYDKASIIGVLEDVPSMQDEIASAVAVVIEQPEEDCDSCKYGYFGDQLCDTCRVGYPSHYERRTDEQTVSE